MAMTTGSFGLLKPHFEITPERVTITRNVWVPFALLVCGLAGIVFLAQAFGHHFDGTMFGIGFVLTMAGVFAGVMTPWLLPVTITCTREGIVWGGIKHPVQNVVAVHARSTEIRMRYNAYLSWSIVVALANKKVLLMSLGNRNRGANVQPLEALGRAMATMLGKPY